MNLLQSLPAIYQTDTTTSLYNNLFDKFLSEDNTVEVSGTIGTSTTQPIPEFTDYRTNNQLQPYMVSNVGNRTKLTSFEDFMQTLKAWGVDLDKFNQWGKQSAFSLFPCIDLDKFNNYQNYYWISSTVPDYVTIKNRYLQLTYYVVRMFNQHPTLQGLVQTAVNTQLPADILAVNNIVPDFFESYSEHQLYITNDPTNQILAGGWDNVDWDGIIDSAGWDSNDDYTLTRDARLQRDEWSANNMWVNVSNIPSTVNLSQYHRATTPIIEFDSYIELNEWVKVERDWKYSSGNGTFGVENYKPTVAEITSHALVQHPTNLSGFTISVDQSIGQLLISQSQLTIELITGQTFIYPVIVNYTINGSTYTFETNYNFTSVSETDINVHPLRYSSRGDSWIGFTNHWELQNTFTRVPCENRVDVAETYATSLHGGTSTIYTLPQTYISNTSELRVYVNGRRQYGTFAEGNFVSGVFTQSDVPTECNAIKFDEQTGAGILEIMFNFQDATDEQYARIPVRYQSGNVHVTNLFQYFKLEQQKLNVGQYPLFNRYNNNGQHDGTVTTVWQYDRLSDQPVNVWLNDRIGLQFINDLSKDGRITFVSKRDTVYSDWQLVTSWRLVGDVVPAKTGNDWNLPSYFKYNPLHANRREFEFSYTVSHFTDIINAQPGVWIDNISPINSLGSIREHNNNVDWLWSHIHCELPSVPDIIKYALDSYSRNISSIRAYALDSLNVSNLMDPTALYSISKSKFEQSDILTKFGDSTCSINNFTSTPVTLGWIKRTIPSVVLTGDGPIVTHHDGHNSIVQISTLEMQQVVDSLISQGVNKVPMLTSVFGISNTNIVYAVANKLYKLKPVSFGTTGPTYLLNPGEIWIDTTTSQIWVGSDGVNILTVESMCWDEISIPWVIANTILKLENELYAMGNDVVPNLPVYDMEEELYSFVRSAKLDPSITTDYTSSNPFTWNYSSVYPTTPRWYTLYEQMFNTRFPHLEPWKIQGYTMKPVWWDTEYKDYSGTRVWKSVMWTNIRNGNVPFGRAFPNGNVSTGTVGEIGYNPLQNVQTYTVIPVNTSDIADEYGLDSLLPPYFYTNYPELSDSCRLVSTAILPSVAAAPYQYGQKGPLEDVWRRSINFVYDQISRMWKEDPINVFANYIGVNSTAVESGLVVNDQFQNILPYNQLPHHGDIVNGVTQTYNGMYQWMSHMMRYTNNDFDLNGYRDIRTQSSINFGYGVSGFTNQDNLRALKSQNGIFTNEMLFDVTLKQSTIVPDASITALRCFVYNVGSSTISNGVRVPVNKGTDWAFSLFSMNPDITEVILYEPSTTVESTFQTVNGSDVIVWNVLGTTTQPITYRLGTPIHECHPLFTGIEGVIAFINSYEKYLIDIGYGFDNVMETTNQGNSWGLSLYNFVNEVYAGLGSTSIIPFLGYWSHISISVGTNNVQCLTSVNKFTVGQQLQLFSTGKLPSPITTDMVVVVSAINGNQISLTTLNGTPIVFSNSGQGFISMGMHRIEVRTPATFYEFNPFQYGLKFNHDVGLLSQIKTQRLFNSTTVYDQYGDVISPESLSVLRTDKNTIVKIKPNVLSVKYQTPAFVGSMYPKLNTWEHVILFQNNSVDGDIWFDSSLGAFTNVIRLYGRFFRDGKFKPTVGGSFINNGQLVSNITSSAKSHGEMFDNNTSNNVALTQAARNLINFNELEYMSNLGISLDTQYKFYQQMIKTKGLTEIIQAFVKSRFFVGAGIDEVWAYKVGTYGTSKRQVFQDISLAQTSNYGNVLIVNVGDVITNPLYNSDNYRQQFDLAATIKSYNRITSVPQVVQLNDQFDSVVCKLVTDEFNYSTSYSGSATFVVTPWPTSQLSKLRGIVKLHNATTIVELPVVLINSSGITVDFGSNVPQIGDVVTIKLVGKDLIDGTDYVALYGAKQLAFMSHIIGNNVDVTTYGPDNNLSPVQIVKTDTNVVLDRLEFWDPASNIHDGKSQDSIDFTSTQDIAHYTNSLIPTDVELKRNWGPEYVGNVWWDTSLSLYKPYHESRLYEGDDRIKAWGELTEFGEINVYEWIESPTIPSEYVQYAKKEGITAVPKIRTLYRTRTSPSSPYGSWKVNSTIIKEFSGYQFVNNVIPVSTINLTPGKLVIYVNGISEQSFDITNDQVFNVYTLSLTLNNWDVIHVVKHAYVPTSDDLKYDPLVKDDTRLVQFINHTPYVHRVTLNEFDVPVNKYYFWAYNTQTVHKSGTITRIAESLRNHNNKFTFLSNISNNSYVTVTLVGSRNVTSDMAMRIVLNSELESSDPSEYTEWKTVRLNQKTNIPRLLWDKMVEAMIGYKLTNSTTISQYPVPSLDLVLYDDQNNTSLQYGLGEKQAFAPRADIVELVNNMLLDPTIDLYPVDRDVFNRDYNMDTVENMVELMDAMYRTFSPLAVNTIWFGSLYAGLASNSLYEGILKTSYIHLDSTQSLLELGS